MSSPTSFLKHKGFKPFPFQKQTWAAYRKGESGLLHAPTGQGKTMAVYLGPLVDSLEADGCAILWITPLRALAADTLRALREPQQFYNPKLKAEARTGDTPASVKARLRKRLPHTLVTTPESLSLMLTHPDTREKLQNLRCVIVDEWHELLGTKRGIQTELCLARLRHWLPNLRTWALSATLGNLKEAALTIAPQQPQSQNLGDLAVQNSTQPQPSTSARNPSLPLITDHYSLDTPTIISAKTRKPILIETIIPREIGNFPWSGHIGTSLAPQVIRHIESSKTTLLFTNTRSQTEIWFQELLSLRPDWKDRIAMHHGSLDRAERDIAETGLREGSLKCVVATSSLDLGVDFSPVDQVIQVGSPKGVARLLQRAGRSGHQPGAASRIICVPTNAMELIEFAAARKAAKDKTIESRQPLSKPLDVLVQHLVTCAIGEAFLPDKMFREIRSCHAYRDLSETEWQWALDHITRGGKALSAYPRFKKVVIDPEGRYGVTDKRLITQHRLSIGTITSDSYVSLKFANGQTLGTVEEGFISKLKPGSTLIFSGRHLSLIRIRNKVATVKPASKSKQGKVAIWGGTKMPLSTELSHAFSELINSEFKIQNLELTAASTQAKPSISREYPELKAVYPIIKIQEKWSHLPSSEFLLVEHTHSREGEHLFLYPFAGRLAHEGLAALLAFRISRSNPESITATQNDYGFCLTAKRGLPFSENTLRELLSPADLLPDLLECMNTAELARRQFREIARVSGLILQPMPGRRQTASQRELQSSASLLYEVLQRYDPENLLLAQSEREILEKQLELTRLATALKKIQTQPFVLQETEKLTPFAFPLWADRLQATHIGADAATRLEAMLEELNLAV
jgi:ATP-dependent Lhr-like helicase